MIPNTVAKRVYRNKRFRNENRKLRDPKHEKRNTKGRSNVSVRVFFTVQFGGPARAARAAAIKNKKTKKNRPRSIIPKNFPSRKGPSGFGGSVHLFSASLCMPADCSTMRGGQKNLSHFIDHANESELVHCGTPNDEMWSRQLNRSNIE